VKNSGLLLASVLVAGLAVPARAATILDGNVAFEFTVGSTKLPAGHYQVQANPGEDVLTVRSVDTGKSATVPYLTRIWARDESLSAFVFDVVGGEHILSEVHLANSDGYLLAAAAKKPHAHKVVKVS
jgi:hypothetical protein